MTWDDTVLKEVDAEVDRARGGVAPAGRPRVHARHAGVACLVDGPDEAMAVANTVAPEHLELMVDEAPAPHCRRSVQTPARCSSAPGRPPAWATTSPGPTTCCRPTARRASPRRCGPTTSARHMHAVRVTPGALRTLGPPRRHAGPDRGPAGARRLRPQPPRRPRRPSTTDPRRTASRRRPAPGPMSPVPPVGPTSAGEGYHSPQVEAEVRLNTNESPFAPPDAWREELLEALATSSFHRYPDRPATDLRRPSPTLHRVDGRRGLLRQRVQRGPPVASCLPSAGRAAGRRCSSPRTRCTRTSPASPAPRSSRARATTTSRSTPTTPAPAHRGTAARCHLPLLAQQPDGAGRAARDLVEIVAGAAPGLVVVDEAYGQFSPWTALELRRAGPTAGPRGHPHVLQDVGHGGRPARLPGGRPRGRAGLRGGRAAVPPLGARRSWPACSRSVTSPRWRRGWRVAEERGRVAAALGDLPVDSWPSDANFILFRPRGQDANDVWQCLLDRSVLIRNCAGWEGLKGCLRVTVGHAGGERPLPARAEGEPVTADARPDAPRHGQASRARDQGDHDRGRARPRRHRHTDVSTGLPFFDHMLEQLGKHASFDLTVHGRGRPARRRAPHGRGRRHRPRRLPGRGARRQGGRPALRLDAAPARRGARPGRARPLGPALPGLRPRLRPRHAGPRHAAVRPATGRGVLARLRHGGGRDAAHPPAARARTRTTCSRPASRAWPGACATRCGSRGAASLDQGQPVTAGPPGRGSPSSTTASGTSGRPRRPCSTSARRPASSTDPAEVEAADAVVLPGVGAFGACAAGLARERARGAGPRGPRRRACPSSASASASNSSTRVRSRARAPRASASSPASSAPCRPA